MRFATFVAFVLPLAAFADSTPSTPFYLDLCDQFLKARVEFEDIYGNTIGSFATIVTQIGASHNSQELAVFHDVKDAESMLDSFTFANYDGTAPSDTTHQVAVVTGNMKAQSILADLNKKVQDKKFNGNFGNNLDLGLLQSSISISADGVNDIVRASLKIIVLRSATGTTCGIDVSRR